MVTRPLLLYVIRTIDCLPRFKKTYRFPLRISKALLPEKKKCGLPSLTLTNLLETTCLWAIQKSDSKICLPLNKLFYPHYLSLLTKTIDSLTPI